MRKFNIKIKCTCICENVVFADTEEEAITKAELIIINDPDKIRGIDLIDLINTKNKVVAKDIVS